MLLLEPKSAAIVELHSQVHRVQRAWLRSIFFRGTVRLGLIGVVGLLVLLWLDMRLALPGLVRAILLVTSLSAFVLLIRRWLLLPYRRARSEKHVVERIEAYFPQFNDLLHSAIAFTKPEAALHRTSQYFREITVQRALTICQVIDVRRAVPRSPLRIWWGLWLGATVLWIWTARNYGDAAWLSFQRVVMPFEDNRSLSRTRISLIVPNPVPTRIGRGESLELVFQLAGVIPQRVRLQLAGEGNGLTETVHPVSFLDGIGYVKVRLDGPRLRKTFRFRLIANDAETKWYEIEVHSLPSLVPLDGKPSPQFRLVYPRYTRLHPTEEVGTNTLEAIAGTRYSLRAGVDRPVVRSHLHYRPENARYLAAASLLPLSGGVTWGTVGSCALTAELYEGYPVDIDPSGRQLEVTFVPTLPGTYQLTFEDATGLIGSRSLEFKVLPDRSPTITLIEPQPGRQSLSLVPDGSLNIAVTAKDDAFEVDSVQLHYWTQKSPGRRQEFWFQNDKFHELAPLVEGLLAQPFRLSPLIPYRFSSVHLSQRLELNRFRHSDGSPLIDGDVLTLQFLATDQDNLNDLKEPGRSNEIEIVIVSRNHLDAILQQGLANIRSELLPMLDLQRRARGEIQELLAKHHTQTPISPEELEQLKQLEFLQRQISTRVRAPEDGLLTQLNRLLEMIRNNRLEANRTTERIEETEAQLQRLLNEDLEPVEPLLMKTRKAVTAKSKDATNDIIPLLEETEKQQVRVESRLRKILDRLDPWSGAGEIRGETRIILSELRKNTEFLEKARRERKLPTAGKTRSELSPEQQAELDRLAIRPDRISDRTRQLLERMDRLVGEREAQLHELEAEIQQRQQKIEQMTANPPLPDLRPEERDRLRHEKQTLQAELESLERRKQTNAQEIAAFRRAVQEGRTQELKASLQRVPSLLRENQVDDAIRTEQEAAEMLERIIEALREQPGTKDLAQLAKRSRDTQGEVEQLAKKQQSLDERMRKADRLENPAEREAELKRLAREQMQLLQETERLSERLQKSDEPDPSAEELSRAAEQMDLSRKELEAGRFPDRSSEEALNKLDDALEQLDRKQQTLTQQLLREKATQATEQLKGIRRRQQTTLDEWNRLTKQVAVDGGWSNLKSGAILRMNLSDLQRQEDALIGDLQPLIERQFKDSPVFVQLLKQANESMQRVVDNLKLMREEALDEADGLRTFDASAHNRSSDNLRNEQLRILQTFDILLDALKPEEWNQGQTARNNSNTKSDNPPESDTVPLLPQLKALRAFQADIAARTAALDQAYPNRDNLTEDAQAELQRLQRSQEAIARLVKELVAASAKEDQP